MAGFINAVSHMCLAVPSSIPSRTSAKVAIQLIYAQRARLGARIALTLVHLLCAVITCQSIWTDAAVFCGARGAAAFLTGGKRAGIVEFITVFAHVSHPLCGTDAGVVVHCVHTDGSIPAGSRQAFVCCGCAQCSWNTEEISRLLIHASIERSQVRSL